MLAVISVQDHVQFARIACMVYQPRVMNTDTPYTSPVRELKFHQRDQARLAASQSFQFENYQEH